MYLGDSKFTCTGVSGVTSTTIWGVYNNTATNTGTSSLIGGGAIISGSGSGYNLKSTTCDWGDAATAVTDNSPSAKDIMREASTYPPFKAVNDDTFSCPPTSGAPICGP